MFESGPHLDDIFRKCFVQTVPSEYIKRTISSPISRLEAFDFLLAVPLSEHEVLEVTSETVMH